MKKLFFLFVIMLAGVNVSSFGQTRKDEITVDGFDGDKPLKRDEVVIVNYPERGMQGIWEDAYKGETRKSFLKRINEHSEEFKESYSVKKTHHKEEEVLLVPPVDYHATYRKPYVSNALKSKREHLTLQEFSDSITMSENNHEAEPNNSSVDVSNDTKKDEAMTQAKAQMIVLFIFCLVVLFYVFSKVPPLLRRKK